MLADWDDVLPEVPAELAADTSAGWPSRSRPVAAPRSRPHETPSGGYDAAMTTTPQEPGPDPEVVPSGDPAPIPTGPQPGIDPHEDPQTQPAP